MWAGGLVIGFGLIVLLAFSLVTEEVIAGVPDGTEQVVVDSREHVEGRIYADNEVPAGGPHAPIWQNCGFYDSPVLAENALHSLEHGAVWIAYSPDLGPDQIGILREYAGPNEKVLISPVADQGSPIILTAWGSQLKVQIATDSRVEQFVNEFTRSLSAPEPGGRCNGGVGNPSF